MKFSDYKTNSAGNLPPNLEVGQVLQKITRVEAYTFQLDGKDTDAMRIFADGKEFKTTSKPIREQLTKFFETHPNEVIENVKIVQPRGKRYMTLESA